MNIKDIISEGPIDAFKQGFQRGLTGTGTTATATKSASSSPLSSVDPKEFKQIIGNVLNQQALTDAQLFTLKELYRKL